MKSAIYEEVALSIGIRADIRTIVIFTDQSKYMAYMEMNAPEVSHLRDH